jgi:hypothetical protein
MSALFSNGEMVGGSVENTNFTSSDVADGQATSWTSVTPIVNDEPNVSLFTKLSQIVKNVGWLYKTLGTTDLSAIADGTVSGAISELFTPVLVTSGTGYTIYRCGKVVNVVFSSYPTSSAQTISDLPKPALNRSISGTLINGTTFVATFIVLPDGTLIVGATSMSCYGSTSYITSE